MGLKTLGKIATGTLNPLPQAQITATSATFCFSFTIIFRNLSLCEFCDDTVHINSKHRIQSHALLAQIVTIRSRNMQTLTNEKNPQNYKLIQKSVERMERSTRWIFFVRPEQLSIGGAQAYCTCAVNVVREHNRTKALENWARPTPLRNAIRTSPPVQIDTKHTHVGKAACPDNSSRLITFFFLTIVPKINCPMRQPNLLVVLMCEPLRCTEKESEVVFKNMPTYKVLLIYRVTVQTMCTDVNMHVRLWTLEWVVQCIA